MKKKQQVRQCISCRAMLERDSFIRLTKTVDLKTSFEFVVINPNKYQIGRSAYICKNPECLKKVIKSKRLSKLLKTSSSIVDKVVPALEKIVPQLRKGALVS